MSEHDGEQVLHKPSNDHETEQVYHYRHAGIRERDGVVPLWLILVVLGLLIWSIYYLLRYWSPT